MYFIKKNNEFRKQIEILLNINIEKDENIRIIIGNN